MSSPTSKPKNMDPAAASLMHRRYRLYGTRLTENESYLYPIDEGPDEEQPRPARRWALMVLMVCSVGFVGLLVLSAVTVQSSSSPKSHFPTVARRERFIKTKKQNGKRHGGHDLTHGEDCNDGGYSKRTLQRAYELPFSALFRDNRGQKKYEASSVIVVDNDVYAICDSSWAISKFTRDLTPFGPDNVQIGDPYREPEDSGYEALFYENGVFYVVRESINTAEGKAKSFHAIIEELEMGETDYKVINKCESQFEFEGDSKGFEGAIAIRDLKNELVVLGLCEGNYCSEQYKDDTGNGRVIAMKKQVADDGSCSWNTVKKIKIPPSCNFRDYSALTLSPEGRVAISSQEDSQVWISSMLGRNEESGLWDIDALEFDEDKAQVYDFPKNDNCQTVYCNIEGIHWIEHNMLMAVSDKMKSHGKQDFRCFGKDQSVHAFVIP